MSGIVFCSADARLDIMSWASHIMPSGCSSSVSGYITGVPMQSTRQDAHEIYQTAKCFACGKFFKLPSRYMYTAVCPHCNTEASC